MTPQELIKIARSWKDTPVKPVGAVKGEGCNCLGLWAGIAKECEFKELWEAFAPWQGHQIPQGRTFLIRELRRLLIRTKKFEPGVVLLIKDPNVGYPCHIAGYTGNGNIIEAIGNKVSEHRLHSSVKVIEKYRIPGVNYD